MQYKGNLYGKVAGKYLDLGYTSDDFDALQKTVEVIANGDMKAFGILGINLARDTIKGIAMRARAKGEIR